MQLLGGLAADQCIPMCNETHSVNITLANIHAVMAVYTSKLVGNREWHNCVCRAVNSELIMPNHAVVERPPIIETRQDTPLACTSVLSVYSICSPFEALKSKAPSLSSSCSCARFACAAVDAGLLHIVQAAGCRFCPQNVRRLINASDRHASVMAGPLPAVMAACCCDVGHLTRRRAELQSIHLKT